jgi:hypothetical protein
VSTFFNVVFVVLGVSAVVCLAIAAFMGEGRARSGGPPRGSLERDDDEEQRHA